MKDNFRVRLEKYLSSMMQAKYMLAAGLLRASDYAAIDRLLSFKYGVSINNLYRGVDRLYEEV